MADNDLFRRSLDAGLAFTEVTRKRAEQIVRDLVKNGEINREQAASRVEELIERSRQNSDAVIAIVRKEIDDRIAQLNLVTREDLASLAARLGIPTSAKASAGTGAQGGPSPAAPMAPGAPMVKKPPAKKSPAAAAKKAPAKAVATQFDLAASTVKPTSAPATTSTAASGHDIGSTAETLSGATTGRAAAPKAGAAKGGPSKPAPSKAAGPRVTVTGTGAAPAAGTVPKPASGAAPKTAAKAVKATKKA